MRWLSMSLELQERHFGAPHPGAVEGHQQARCRRFPAALMRRATSSRLSTVGESSVILGIGQVFSELVSFESSDKEEAQCRDTG